MLPLLYVNSTAGTKRLALVPNGSLDTDTNAKTNSSLTQ